MRTEPTANQSPPSGIGVKTALAIYVICEAVAFAVFIYGKLRH
ncbi:MAG: hypothetical protein U0X75_26340 [Acidobacteriota bacterium]